MQAPPNCGNGELTDDEACDDGNKSLGRRLQRDVPSSRAWLQLRQSGQSLSRDRALWRRSRRVERTLRRRQHGAGDGCSERCKIELGKKCDGSPSVCTDAECGNSIVEGAESCDDGNDVPFDGCSSLCLREPNCKAETCTSDCGDGLVINEGCDDGNTLDGDGCSATCTVETGFTCKQEPQCEKVNGQCVLRVPAIFRDFWGSHPDFGGGNECGLKEGDPIVPGIAGAMLDAEGRPVLGTAPASACIQSAQSFGTWFRDGAGAVRVVGNVVLFDNGEGGYVNRFGDNGEKLVVYVAARAWAAAVTGATSQATCAPGCTTRTRSSLQCDNQCRPDHDAVADKTRQHTQREQELAQRRSSSLRREAQANPDAAAIATLETQIAALEAQIAELEADIETLTAAADACDTACQTQFDALVDACVADCKPCSGNPTQWCTGGVAREFDGTPVFFPVDGVMGADPRRSARPGFPLNMATMVGPTKTTYFPGAPLHNFYFTSEVQYWFRTRRTPTRASTSRETTTSGCSSTAASRSTSAASTCRWMARSPSTPPSAARFGLTPGNVYKIAVFQAERKRDGSSFRLTFRFRSRTQ